MADNVEGLYIEVESQSGAATKQIDALADSLERLKSKLSNNRSFKTFSKNYAEMVNTFNSVSIDYAKLESFRYLSQITTYFNSKSATPLKSFAKNYVEAVNSINNGAAFDRDKLESLRYFSYVLGGMRGLTISPTIAKQIDNIGFSIQNINAGSLANVSEFVEAVVQLERIKDVKISKSFVTNFAELAEVSQKLNDYDFTKLNEFTTALANMGSLANVDSSAVKGLASSIKTMGNETKTASTRGRTFNTVLANIRTRTMALVMATQRLARIATKSMSIYGDYVEALNLFKMALGEAAGEEYEFAKRAQDLLGIDLTEWMQAQGVFNALAKGFGVASDKAALMSRNLTQLAYDISSFYNISVEDAIQKVQSGFAGQIRPVRNLGYDLSQARLEAIALANGIDEEVKSMTQAEKSQLRYIALMTQLTEVQGDLARTLDSPTNQMRLLNAQLDQMQRSIGLVLLPLLNKVIPYLNAIFRVIKMIANEIAALFGYTLPELSGTDFTTNISMGADELEEDLNDANGAAEKLKNTLASFDQINLITSKSGGSGSGGSSSVGGSDLGLDLPSYDFLGDVTENQAQEIAEGMMRSLRPFVDWLKDTILWTKDHLDDIAHLLEILAVVTIGKNLWDKIQGTIKWFNELSNTVKGIGFLTIGFQLSYLGGKDLAEGDIVGGIIKSALGAAASAYGGFLLLGSTGLVLGLGLSVALIYTGYQLQKQEEFKQHISDLFHSFDEGKASLDQLTESWGKFTEEYTNTEWLKKYTGEGKDSIGEVGIAINNLQGAYTQGLVDAEYYVEELSRQFGELKDSVLGYLDESRQAITEQLNGELGVFLLTLGYTQEEINEMLDRSTENITKDFDELSKTVEAARQEFEKKGDVEAYQKAIDEASQKISEYYGTSGLMSKQVKDFNDSMEVFKNGISLDSLDDVLATIKQINSDYDTAIKSLHDERDQTVDYFNTFVAGMPPEMQSRYQGLIDSVEKYFSDQEESLKQGYRDTMGVLEDEAVGRWTKVFDTEGLKGVQVAQEEILSTMGEAIEKSYKKRDITMENSVFGELLDVMDKVDKAGRENYVMGGQTHANEKFAAAEDFAKIWRGSQITLDDFAEALHKNEKTVPKYIADMWKKVINENSTEGDKFTKEGALIVQGVTTEYANLSNNVPESIRRMAEKSRGYTDDARRSLTSITSNTVSSMLQVYKENGKEIPEEVKRLMAKTQDMIQPTEFATKGSRTASEFIASFKKDFTPVQAVNDFKDKFSRMFQGDDAKRWGEQLGSSVKNGVEGGLTGTEKAMDFVFRGMAQSMNTFADRSYEYWTGMSTAIALAWNAVKLDTSGRAFVQLMGAYTKATAWHIKGYASGGFPGSADFFYANENGVPEYVGTMGGRTAVANNQEITKGVADAVYKAIKDTGIANDVKKIASKDGKVVFAPSEEAGRVMSQSVNMYNSTGGRY